MDQLSLFTEPKNKGLELNDNQNIVLEHLKESADTQGNVLTAISRLVNLSHFPSRRFCTDESVTVVNAYQTLSRVEQAQVLQSFAAWVLQEGVVE